MTLLESLAKITDSQEALVSLELSAEQTAGGLIAAVMDRVACAETPFCAQSIGFV